VPAGFGTNDDKEGANDADAADDNFVFAAQYLVKKCFPPPRRRSVAAAFDAMALLCVGR